MESRYQSTNCDSDNLMLIFGIVVLGALLLPSAPFFLIIYFLIRKFKLVNLKGALILFSLVLLTVVYSFFGAGVHGFMAVYNAAKSVYAAIMQKDLSVVIWKPLIIYGMALSFFEGLFYVLFEASRPIWTRKKLPTIIEIENVNPKKLKNKLASIQKVQHPENGTVLGVDISSGNTVILTDDEMNGHALLLGATGSGKTTTIMSFGESCCQRDVPMIIIDGKGDPEFSETARNLANRYGKKFYLFSTVNLKESCHYNPLKHGGATELKDKLIATSDWSEEHYKKQAERYLQSVFRLFEKVGEKVDLVNVVEKLAPKQLALLIRQLPKDEAVPFLSVVEVDEEEIGGLINRLAVFAESEIAELFVEDDNTLDLVKAVEEKAVIFFSLDSLRFPEYARLLGRLIVLDIKTVVSRMFGRNMKIYAVFDEFGVFASNQVVDFINKSRGAGFHCMLSVQELADLRAGGGETLMNQIIGNTNVKIIQRQDVPDSAEFLASVIGTAEDITVTHQVNEGGMTGTGTVKKERSFLVHPDEIKRLSRGEAAILKKFPKYEVIKAVIRKPDFEF